MDGHNDRLQRSRVRGILIQTRSRLPEVAIRSIRVRNGELLQEVGSVDLQPGNRPDGYRPPVPGVIKT